MTMNNPAHPGSLLREDRPALRHSVSDTTKGIGVTQPRISDLMRGKIDLFSVDTLITMLTHAGLRVDVKVTRSAA